MKEPADRHELLEELNRTLLASRVKGLVEMRSLREVVERFASLLSVVDQLEQSHRQNSEEIARIRAELEGAHRQYQTAAAAAPKPEPIAQEAAWPE